MSLPTRAEYRMMFIEEGVRATAEILAADRHPRAAEILVAVRARFEAMNFVAAARESRVQGLSLDEARARWKPLVTQGIRRDLAEMRPN